MTHKQGNRGQVLMPSRLPEYKLVFISFMLTSAKVTQGPIMLDTLHTENRVLRWSYSIKPNGCVEWSPAHIIQHHSDYSSQLKPHMYFCAHAQKRLLHIYTLPIWPICTGGQLLLQHTFRNSDWTLVCMQYNHPVHIQVLVCHDGDSSRCIVPKACKVLTVALTAIQRIYSCLWIVKEKKIGEILE